VFRDGTFDPGGAFLAKPFTRQTLTQKVREVLDRAPHTTASVLVIDDDADIRKLLGDILRGAGYIVSEGIAPADREAAPDARIDVVLADVASSQQTLRALYHLRRAHPEAKILLMAGAFGDRLLRDVDRLGAHATLQKPLNEQSVLAAVAGALHST
jgi:DNA-binding NtrC family response regulator